MLLARSSTSPRVTYHVPRHDARPFTVSPLYHFGKDFYDLSRTFRVIIGSVLNVGMLHWFPMVLSRPVVPSALRRAGNVGNYEHLKPNIHGHLDTYWYGIARARERTWRLSSNVSKLIQISMSGAVYNAVWGHTILQNRVECIMGLKPHYSSLTLLLKSVEGTFLLEGALYFEA